MKVVIDIPEDRYADIQRIASVQLDRRYPTTEQIISKGVIINEPRKGKWISICNGKQCNCSICGKGYDHTYEFIEEWNFCPNCGADMRQGGDSE